MEIKALIEVVNSYYPPGITLNSDELLKDDLFMSLTKRCLNVDTNRWAQFLDKLKRISGVEITEFVLLSEFNPSFIAVFLTENFKRSGAKDYESQQIILKISVIAPVFWLYFDNFASDWNQRLIRSNPITDKEFTVINLIHENLKEHYNDFLDFNISNAFHSVDYLGDISSSNKRKPYLDECIFGLYLSIHPHNILIDKVSQILPGS